MRRDNLRRVQMESSNLETQLASEIGVGLAQRAKGIVREQSLFLTRHQVFNK